MKEKEPSNEMVNITLDDLASHLMDEQKAHGIPEEVFITHFFCFFGVKLLEKTKTEKEFFKDICELIYSYKRK